MFRSLVFTALASPDALNAANDELAGPADRAEIMMTVRTLLEALRQGEAEPAFRLLSDEFRTEMGTARRFLSSMRKTCKPLCEARFVEFDALSAVDGLLIQELSLIGLNGGQATGYFLMERPAGKDWHVGSCIVDTQATALHA